MRSTGCRHDQLVEFDGVEEINAVITTEGAALDLEPVVMNPRIEFRRISNEGPGSFRKLAVGAQINALISDQPQARLAIVDIGKPVCGSRNPPFACASAMRRAITARTSERPNVSIVSISLTQQSHREDGADAPAAWL